MTNTIDALPPTVTTDDLRAIDIAIATGVNVVEFRDRRTEFRSHNDLLRARAFIIARLNEQGGVKKRRRAFYYVQYAGRGY
jgi:hypothetical protein